MTEGVGGGVISGTEGRVTDHDRISRESLKKAELTFFSSSFRLRSVVLMDRRCHFMSLAITWTGMASFWSRYCFTSSFTSKNWGVFFSFFCLGLPNSWAYRGKMEAFLNMFRIDGSILPPPPPPPPPVSFMTL